MKAEAPAHRPETIKTPITLPMSDIPLERGYIPESQVHVAGHEFNHAYVAHALGVGVAGISVVPEGNSLGRTILAGIASPEALKIIAAAGSAETHDGTAHGFGSDLMKARLMSAYFGGSSVGAAQAEAARIIAGIAPDVRRRAAEIIAYKKEFVAPDIAKILDRARVEVELQNGNQEFVNIDVSHKEPVQDLKREFTVIDNLGADQRVRYIVKGRVKKEEIICQVCLGVNGHFENCARRVVEDIDTSNQSIPATAEKIDNNSLQKKLDETKEPVHRRRRSGGRCKCNNPERQCRLHPNGKKKEFLSPSFPKEANIFRRKKFGGE